MNAVVEHVLLHIVRKREIVVVVVVVERIRQKHDFSTANVRPLSQ